MTSGGTPGGAPSGSRGAVPERRRPAAATAVRRRLRLRRPYDWDSLIGFLMPRASALGAADAFPAGDLVLRRAFDGGTITAARLRRRAEPWRPWRAYAAVHLWRAAATATAPAAQ